MLNGDGGLLGINLANRGLLVKILITQEPHGILYRLLIHFNIYLPIGQPYFV